jgi:hypothetical protein
MLILLFFCIPILSAQDESAIRSILAEADLKKLEKAENFKADAEGLVGEAYQLNMEVYNVQVNPDLDEKAIAKKVKQLESAAREKQVAASALYEKCYEIKFSLYKQYMDAFWKEHENQESNFLNAKLLEEQASDHYFEAVSYRIEARKMEEGYARIEKLTEAKVLEDQAIQKQVMALAQYHGISEPAAVHQPEVVSTVIPDLPDIAEPTDTTFTQVEQQSETSVVQSSPTLSETQVNQSMIDDQNRNVETSEFTDTNLIGDTGVTSFDSDSLHQLSTNTPAAGSRLTSGILFRVQVTASRVPLTLAQLKRIYGGTYSLEMVTEDGWYTYQIMGVRLYSDALQIVRNVTTESALIVAYEEGKKVDLADAVKNTQALEQDDKLYGRKGQITDLEFHIQIAASRRSLSSDELAAVYAGSESISVIIEEGWYKYHLKAGNSPLVAEQLRLSCRVNGAFIVPYQRAAKISLVEAKRQFRAFNY